MIPTELPGNRRQGSGGIGSETHPGLAAFPLLSAFAIAASLLVGCRAVDEDPYGLSDLPKETVAAGDASKEPAETPEVGEVDREAIGRPVRPSMPGGSASVVARVDGEDIGAEAVLSALFLTQTESVFAALEHAITEHLIIKEARRLGVTVGDAQIEAGVQRVLADQQELFELERGPGSSLMGYLNTWFGVSEAAFLGAIRRRVTHELFLSRVIRYEARQHDRVQYRVLILPDIASAQEARSKLQAGANFGALAQNYSLDESRRGSGGLFPPVAADCPHAMITGAPDLAEGGVSDVLPYVERGQAMTRLLKLERRVPADPRPYSVQSLEIERELSEQPIDRFELIEWDRRMRDRYPVEVGLWRA